MAGKSLRQSNNNFWSSIGSFRQRVLHYCFIPILIFIVMPVFKESDMFMGLFTLAFVLYGFVDIFYAAFQLVRGDLRGTDFLYRFGYFFLMIMTPVVSFLLVALTRWIYV